MTPTQSIEEHYAVEGMRGRLEAALMNAGYGDGPIPWSDLAIIDQFHIRGLQATKDLIETLNPQPGQTLLDLGSGLGGPARFVAATREVQVSGIDLTGEYVSISAYLSERSGLADRTRFVQGSATETPFENGAFDYAWTQHVAMNIADKDALYREAFRLVKPGGKFAIYDVAQGSEGPVRFPVPWADEQGQSFLITPDELKTRVSAAGFTIESFEDQTALALAWFAEFQAMMQQQAANPNPLNPMAILGANTRDAVMNVPVNIREGRIQVVQLIASKP